MTTCGSRSCSPFASPDSAPLQAAALREKWDAVRIPPGTWRGYEAGSEGLEIIVIGAPNLGAAPREDVEGQRDWWAD